MSWRGASRAALSRNRRCCHAPTPRARHALRNLTGRRELLPPSAGSLFGSGAPRRHGGTEKKRERRERFVVGSLVSALRQHGLEARATIGAPVPTIRLHQWPTTVSPSSPPCLRVSLV